MYHILIAGAGYTGSRIARFFAAKKQKVYALTRSEQKAQAFRAENIHPLVMDLMKPETLTPMPQAHFVVIAVAPDERTEEAYERVYLDAVAHLLERIKKNPRPLLVVYLSSTGVWPEQNGGWVDETLPAMPDTAKSKILLRAETQVLHSGLPSVVLRLAGIYGPGRNRLELMRAGSSSVSAPEAARWMNMIHVEDVAAAMPLIFKKTEEGSILALVDNEPILSPVFYDWLKENMGLKITPAFDARPPVGKRISNQRLRALGYTLQYPTFREGYRAIARFSHRAC